MSLSPRPMKLHPILATEGPDGTQWARHDYVEARPCVVPNPEGVMEDAYEFIYRCSLTGVEKRWGIVDRWVMEGN